MLSMSVAKLQSLLAFETLRRSLKGNEKEGSKKEVN